MLTRLQRAPTALARRTRQAVDRFAFRRAVRTLEPFPVPPRQSGRPEMRIFCGQSGMRELVVTVWSFQRFVGADRWPVIVHEDGTWTDPDRAWLSAMLPGVTFVAPAPACQQMVAELTALGLSRCAALRSSFIFAPKLFDTQRMGGDTPVLQLDTDVLCHQAPTALLDAVHADPFTPRYARDVPTWYGYAWPGLTLPSVNAGLLLYRHAEPAFHRYEHWLATFGPPADAHYQEQTLWALDLTERGARPLPDEYDVAFRHQRQGHPVVTQHYCGGQEQRGPYYVDATQLLLGVDGSA